MVTVAPSSRQLDKVAAAPPRCDADESLCSQVTDSLERTLTLSGFFEMLPRASFLADMSGETLDRTKWEDWFNVGAKYLVKCTVQKRKGGLIDIEFRLFDVNQKTVVKVGSAVATGIKPDAVRRQVHRFVNDMILAITGSRGPFGGEILFSAKTGLQTRGVFAVAVDGIGVRTLAAGDTISMLPSKTRGKLVYTSFLDGKPDVYVNGQKITNDDRHYRGARFSPDGSILAVSVDEDGQSDIYLMSPSGELLKNLTNHWADEVSPSWSPCGTMIAFVSNRTGSPQIYVMNRDGSGQRRLTMAGGYNSTPDFGSNGKVVFAGMDEGASDIFIVDLQGTITRVTQDQGSNKDPTFSPDGRHVAFVSTREGKVRIFLSTEDGRFQFPITEKNRSYSTLFWAR
jgi:TolB protein